LKLMKGELKETLTGVRDFLLELKLPLLPGAGVILDGDGAINLKGGLTIISPDGGSPKQPFAAAEKPARKSAPEAAAPERPSVGSRKAPRKEPRLPEVPEPPMPEVPQAMADSPLPPVPQKVGQNIKPEEKQEDKAADDDANEPKNKKAEEAARQNKEDKMKDEVPTCPQVNLLANLIRWVSVARNEIGNERLRTFLDVYAISGNLPPELKEVILHLAEVVVQTLPDVNASDIYSRLVSERDVYGQLVIERLAAYLDIHSLNGQVSPELRERILHLASSIAQQPLQPKADVWSRLMLELHGILTGGGAPAHFLASLWDGKEKQPETTEMKQEDTTVESAETEADKPVLKEAKPVRLKVVVPAGNGGEDREFDIEEFSVSLD